MLNPEYVDYDEETGNVKIGFTDSDAEEVLTIELSEKEAGNLGRMIMDKVSYRAKLERKKLVGNIRTGNMKW